MPTSHENTRGAARGVAKLATPRMLYVGAKASDVVGFVDVERRLERIEARFARTTPSGSVCARFSDWVVVLRQHVAVTPLASFGGFSASAGDRRNLKKFLPRASWLGYSS